MTNASTQKSSLKKGAIVCLVVLCLYMVGQLVAFFQVKYQLTSPFIPKSTIWQIGKQNIFNALMALVIGIIGLILYFFERYVLVIILATVALGIGGFVSI
jgi:hypothetical protein